MPRAEAQRALASQVEDAIINALLAIAFHDPDRLWAEAQCLGFLEDPQASPDIQRVAITCLGHLARIHGQLSLEKVKAFLEKALARDPSLLGFVDDTLDDIRMFVDKEFDIQNIRSSRRTPWSTNTRLKH